MFKNVLVLIAALGAMLVHATPPVSFGLFSDTPYSHWEQEHFPDLIVQMNDANLAFVVHVGDIKGGAALCSDETYREVFNVFQQSAHPLIFVPGDNEWTDCHHRKNAAFDPLERLEKLRGIFFAGDSSLGQRTLKLNRQSDQAAYAAFRENARWEAGGVLFVAINLPGSKNNYFGTTLGTAAQEGPSAEFMQRSKANASWLSEAFALARRKNLPGVMVLVHANPGFEIWRNNPNESFYRDFLSQLRQETQSFGGPVVLVHGDTHFQHIDQPMVDATSGAVVKNFTRLENFGSPFFGWIEAAVDLGNPKVFSFVPKVFRVDALR